MKISDAFILIGLAIFFNVWMTCFLHVYTRFLRGKDGKSGFLGKLKNCYGENEPPADPPPTKTFTQDDVNRIMAAQRRDLESKIPSDYEDLAKFKQEHEKSVTEAEQKRLEDAGKYDELKTGYETKLTDLSGVITQKDATIRDMQIGFSIQNEAAAQNAYPDAVQLIKDKAVVQEDGSIKIKGKDANGIDTLLDVKTGVEQFLKAKPYLVRAGSTGGSGSSTGAGQGGTGDATSGDLATLNAKLSAAMTAGDHKTARETSQEIKKLQASRGVTPNI